MCVRVKQKENIIHYDGNGTLMNRDSSDALMMWSDYRQTWVIVYFLLIMTLIVNIFIRSSIFVSPTMRSSKVLHKNMFNAILKATMLFLNTNSSGKNINIIILKFKLYTIKCIHIIQDGFLTDFQKT